MRPNEKLEREVAAIGDLPREELAARWQTTYGCPPPKGINRGLLERSAAWHLQAARLGGLSAAARAMLRAGSAAARKHQAAAEAAREGDRLPGEIAEVSEHRPAQSAATARPRASAPLAVGTRLMREWNGRMHVVDVTPDGVLFDGKLYRSLTAVARRITGTHWSGPRFFGLPR